jgi:xanthine dehydrogenase/oxidase
MIQNALLFYVNGERHSPTNIDPTMTLLRFLRNQLELKGTKLGCDEGGCGACTVVVGKLRNGVVEHNAVNSCLLPIGSIHMKHVITVEGVGNVKNAHRIQKAFEKYHASQCGYCTPGFVMSLYGQVKGTSVDIEDCFDGNLCRCTGYKPIVDAARDILCESKTSCVSDFDLAGKCSQEKTTKGGEDNLSTLPSELLTTHRKSVLIDHEKCKWFAPSSIDEALKWYNEHPHSKIISGNTEVGIEAKFKQLSLGEVFYMGDIEDFDSIRKSNEGLIVDAGG